MEACNALPEKHLQIIKRVIIQLIEDCAEARRSATTCGFALTPSG
jgi:hypothetical protein